MHHRHDPPTGSRPEEGRGALRLIHGGTASFTGTARVLASQAEAIVDR